MMKKMKGVVAAIEPNPSAEYEDSRTIFKHQNLTQDYQELQKETEAMKKKLQLMKQKKLTLKAEVRFLRRRFEYLTRKESSKLPAERESMQPENLQTRFTSVTKGKKRSRKEAAFLPPVPRFDLNQERKVRKGKEAASGLVLDLNQKERINGGTEAPVKPMPLPDLNQTERMYNANETTVKNKVPVFDLNQISREEEELHAYGEQMMVVEDAKNSSWNVELQQQQHMDMQMSACRNSGNGSNRSGKRKISWQDPVALSV